MLYANCWNDPRRSPKSIEKNMGNWETHQPRPLKVQILNVVSPLKKKKENGKPQQMTRKSAFGNDIICWVKTRQVAYITLSQPMIPYQIKVKFRESTSMT